jgi:hypothetical protein
VLRTVVASRMVAVVVDIAVKQISSGSRAIFVGSLTPAQHHWMSGFDFR